MRTTKLLLTVALATIIGINSINAQEEKGAEKKCNIFKNVAFTPNFGSLLFYGDIRNYDWYPVMKYQSEYGWGGGLTVSKTFTSVIGLQGQLLAGNLRGTKRSEPIKGPNNENLYKNGMYFKGNIFEMSLLGNFNISNLMFVAKPDRKFTIYGVAGAGLVTFHTQLLSLWTDNFIMGYGYKSKDVRYGKDEEDADGDKLRNTTEAVFPVGLGIRYKLNPKFTLNFEASIRNVNTDKLDGYNTNLKKFGGVQSAKDRYGYTCIGISYRFVPKEEADLEWISPFEASTATLAGTTPEQIAGLTKDGDVDGVSDFFDQEPKTPDGVSVDGSGRALDVDRDRVPDYMDADPFSTKGAKVDENGIEIDSDGDGVPDSKDQEPNTPKGQLVNFQGIAIVGREGAITPEKITPPPPPAIKLPASLPSVYFKLNSEVFTDDPENIKRVAIVGQMLKATPTAKIKLVGHCDETGSEEYNMKLSEKRANAVADHLVKVYGVDKNQLVIEYKGKKEPLAKGLNYINRRVDFIPIQ